MSLSPSPRRARPVLVGYGVAEPSTGRRGRTADGSRSAAVVVGTARPAGAVDDAALRRRSR